MNKKPTAAIWPRLSSDEIAQLAFITLCGDQIVGNPVIDLYDWAPFAAFLAATMDKPTLYRMDDPIARVNIQSTREGEGLNWHFDRSEFTTTILLQAPLKGGELEYRTEVRGPGNPNYDGEASRVSRRLFGLSHATISRFSRAA